MNKIFTQKKNNIISQEPVKDALKSKWGRWQQNGSENQNIYIYILFHQWIKLGINRIKNIKTKKIMKKCVARKMFLKCSVFFLYKNDIEKNQ